MAFNNIYDAPFYKPAKVKVPYPHAIKSGQVVLYQDNNWDSPSFTIDTSDTSTYPPGEPFSFSGHPINDKATWIAFKLRAGTVCTLVEHVLQVPPPQNNNPSRPYNFASAGICVDLIGNGEVQTVDLIEYGSNDNLSGGIWRQVDTTRGWFQLCELADCNGRFNTIFFGEWTTGVWHPLTNWALNGAGSSANYPCLTPPQVLTLARNTDGSGQRVALRAANTFGTHTNKTTVNFNNSGADDSLQAFSYDFFAPVKADVASVTKNYSALVAPLNPVAINGRNPGSTPLTYKVTVAEARTTAVTSQATLAYEMSLGLKQTTTVSVGVPGVVEAEGSITTSFTAQTSGSASQSHTHTAPFATSQTLNFTIPPRTEYSGTATIATGTLKRITETTTGKFYYTEKLPGAVEVPPTERGRPTLWRLEGPVTVELFGEVASQVVVDVKATPI
jgi:hypothetical protein